MHIKVSHKGLEVKATSSPISTTYTVEYKEYYSQFTPMQCEKTLAMVKKRLQRELDHIRSNYMDQFTKQDMHTIQDTFFYTLKTATHAKSKETLHA